MHRETVASKKRENADLLESGSGNSGNSSSNPSSIAFKKEVHLFKERNPSRGQNLGLQFLDDRRVEDTPLTLSSSSTNDSTPWWIQEEGIHTLFWQEDAWEVSYELGWVILPVLRRRLGKNSCTRIDCLASTSEDSKQNLKSAKTNADKELSVIRAIRRHSAEIIISPRPMNYVMFHHKMGGDTHRRMCHTKKVWHTHKRSTHTLYMERGYTHSAVVYGSSTRSIFCCKSWIGDGRQKVKKKIISSSSPTTMQTKQKNLQMSGNRGRWLVKFFEYLNKMQSTEFTCLRRKKEIWQTASMPSLCTSLC